MNRELMHYGIPGQKWGVRRFQNSDGSLTSAGKERYAGSKVTIAKKTIGEREREYLKTRASATEVKQRKGQLSNDEYKYIISRLNYELKIAELSEMENPSIKSLIARAIKGFTKTTTGTAAQINAINTIIGAVEKAATEQ